MRMKRKELNRIQAFSEQGKNWESEVGVGSVFAVRIPVGQADAAEQ